MTRDEFVLFVITLVATALVALGVGFGPWRRRDRDLDRLANLADLAVTPLLDDSVKDELARRLREVVNDYLIADRYQRPRRVQQSIYIACSLSFLMLMWAARDAAGWQQILAVTGGAAIFILAVGITGVPPQEWRMPQWLQSHPQRSTGRVPKEPMAQSAIVALGLHAGQKVLAVGCDPRALAVLRAAVGDDGELVAVDMDQDRRRWSEALILSRGWANVHVGTALTPAATDAFDAAVAIHQVLKNPRLDELLESVSRAVRSGGGFFTAGIRTPRSRNSPANLLALVGIHFEIVEARWGRGNAAVSILARRRGSPID